MKNNKVIQGVLTLTILTVLTACSSQDNENKEAVDGGTQSSMPTMESSNSQTESKTESMEGMQHDDLSEIPVGLQEAENSEYEIGDQVTLLTDHMPGMKGATATIVGAFDTTAYEITFQPTNSDELVENHKWVVQEELAGTKDQEKPLEPGTEIIVEAKHMAGMEGASATIDSSEDTTVYMIDYEPTSGGETVTNHKWFTEDELSKE
ncbi:Protein of unknown function [Carnobacterium iners]|uniref:DUF1541 domain-containing protein n=1 Tax=Carnobacterium iners TaxID=1073423 RepID=A0A1X7MVN3_9LACT|nr:YdhK family protein [Carnobacterium iners]SMH28188.1 Protein of unknown function [Carnobacterium iners]